MENKNSIENVFHLNNKKKLPKSAFLWILYFHEKWQDLRTSFCVWHTFFSIAWPIKISFMMKKVFNRQNWLTFPIFFTLIHPQPHKRLHCFQCASSKHYKHSKSSINTWYDIIYPYQLTNHSPTTRHPCFIYWWQMQMGFLCVLESQNAAN